MNAIYSLSALAAFLIIIAYTAHFNWKKLLSVNYFTLIAIGLIVRLAATKINAGYENDINCFKAWANMLASGGFSNFYTSDAFTDYPPGYMYVLFILGVIRSVFGFNYDSYAFTLLIKLPAILCDLAMGAVIFGLASKKLRPSHAWVLSAIYLLNPAVIINSSVWGQVDSVYTLLIVLSVYFITEKKYMPGYLIFAAGVLVKPQALIFSPVYIFAAFDYLNEYNFNKKSILTLFTHFCCCVLLLAAGILPFAGKGFDFTPVIKQYASTIGSYPYATINAYNFYALVGANWRSVSDKLLFLSYSAWGILFIDLIVLLGVYLLMRSKKKANYFFVAGLINTLTFMFSMRMHERYLFPSLVLFLMAYIFKPKENKPGDKKLLLLYGGFSITLFVNCADVIHVLMNGNDLSLIKDSLPFISLVNMALTGFMLFTAFSAFKRDKPADEAIEESTAEESAEDVTPLAGTAENYSGAAYSDAPVRFTALDCKLMLPLIAVYTIVAFYNLGNMKSPQTTYRPDIGTVITADFGAVMDISRIQYLCGASHDKEFTLLFSTDGVVYMEEQQFKTEYTDVFSWRSFWNQVSARYVRLQSKSIGLMLQEMAFRDENDALIPIISVAGENGGFLFDEQELVPADDKNTYKNSTYFDEIYHARTAYEFIHSLSVYEWTHPPLGKDIIAGGILLFGMTPFGWRFAGTLFGVLMIPLIYLLAKQMFKSSWWAFFAALIFTFDFMHFAQTRIATIDTFVTFFIIGMYYFMYRYYSISFYRAKLYKTLLPLCASGIFMGLAIASKWPGVYAAVGIAVIFFHSLYERYREYMEDRTLPFYKNAGVTIAFCFLFFIAIPLVIYCLSYIPFLYTPWQNGIQTIIKNQQDMFGYHAHLESTHPYASYWWQWPFMLRPIFYYVGYINENLRMGISSFGNPAVWYCGIAAFFYCISAISKRFDKNAFFLLVAFAAQYVPWMLVTRSTYIYHFFPSVPFFVLMVTYLFKDYIRPGRSGRTITIAYAVIVVILFAMFYPVLSGMPVNPLYVNTFLRWMSTWQLI